MKTSVTYKQSVWNDNEISDDPDKSSLLAEYAELAEQMWSWYVLRK